MIWLGVAALCRWKWPFGAPLLSAQACHTWPRKFEFKHKGHQTAITICRGLSHPIGWAALPSDNISGHFFQGFDIDSHLFLMKKKGLRGGMLFRVWHDVQSLVPGSQFLPLQLRLPTPSQQSRMVLFTPTRPFTTACFCTQPFLAPHWAGGRMFQALSYFLHLAVKVHCCQAKCLAGEWCEGSKNCTTLRGAWCGGEEVRRREVKWGWQVNAWRHQVFGEGVEWWRGGTLSDAAAPSVC